jgi:hypothetical protein
MGARSAVPRARNEYRSRVRGRPQGFEPERLRQLERELHARWARRGGTISAEAAPVPGTKLWHPGDPVPAIVIGAIEKRVVSPDRPGTRCVRRWIGTVHEGHPVWAWSGTTYPIRGVLFGSDAPPACRSARCLDAAHLLPPDA